MNIITECLLIAKGFKYTSVQKHMNKLEVNEMTSPKQSGKWNGVSIGRDKDGFFCCTHRARSKSYPHPSKIPTGRIKWVESTG
jgi:hypothetical protein